MSINDIDALFASGAPGFFNSETPVGASVSGPIISATPIQSTDFATKKPETWDDGRAKMLLAITIASNLRTTPDDNGHRTIYIKTWGEQSKAFKQAVQTACGPTASASQALAAGNIFTAAFTGTQPSDFGSPTKIFAYQIQPVNTAMDQAFAQPAAQQYQAPQSVDQRIAQQGQPPAWATQGQPPLQQAAPQAITQQYPQPVQAPAPVQALPQAPAPIAQPAPVAAPAEDPAGKARQLAALGIPNDQIAAATGLDPAVIAQVLAA